ncbi:hypothetical protein [Neptunomonas qingdaonensis]|uniref:Uncharacterized protein n=1 Tax=Neptunomonas qingdaonensis TaxID=1045558 RepID=A0A1I2QR78_9GAMM|nr:hypothetical protein [Neptunomonas qingdaonensis]SFG30143.1 hypothetical protein SAMN05216175_10563 [Neptunomonas qingdaonensis]
MSHYKIKLGKCRTIFFDLEFYVPETSRLEKGFSYNPWDKACKLIGGSFLIANPDKDIQLRDELVRKRIKSVWCWECDSEKALVQQIYDLLEQALVIVHRAHDGKLSPVLCGIGITTSDVLILCDLFRRYQILDNAGVFAFMNKFRVIDLSQLAIGMFNSNVDFLYPKVKNDILIKYQHGTKFSSGTSVWGLYEEKNHALIQERVTDEIMSTHHCYKAIIEDIRRYRSLDVAEKKRQKLKLKQEAL